MHKKLQYHSFPADIRDPAKKLESFKNENLIDEIEGVWLGKLFENILMAVTTSSEEDYLIFKRLHSAVTSPGWAKQEFKVELTPIQQMIFYSTISNVALTVQMSARMQADKAIRRVQEKVVDKPNAFLISTAHGSSFFMARVASQLLLMFQRSLFHGHTVVLYGAPQTK